MNSMLRKELRDTLRWAPVGLIMLTVMIVYTFRQPSYFYTLSNQLFFFTWLCSSAFALLLGLATFLPDEREAARAFLVHRGISLDTIFRRRVLVGLVVYVLTMFAPLVLTAIYLWNIGPLHAPVSPWQVFPACVAVISCSAMYFAGIIVACRPSRWLGSRLLPLGAAFAVSVASACTLERTFGWFTLVCLLAGSIGFLLVVLASRYAFTRLPVQIGPSCHSSRSVPMFLVLTFSALLVCSAICVFPVNMIIGKPGLGWDFAYDETGTPWLVTRPYWPAPTDDKTLFPRVKITDSKKEDTEEQKTPQWSNSESHSYLRPVESQQSSWDPKCNLKILNKIIVSDGAGYLLVYEVLDIDVIRLKSVIGRDRITEYGQPRGLPFESNPAVFGRSQPFRFYGHALGDLTPLVNLQNATYPKLDFINEQGIYQVDLNEGKISTIFDQDISLYCELPSSKEAPDKFLAQSKGTTTVYRKVTKETENQNWQSDYRLEVESTIPTMGHDFGHYIWLADNKNWTRIDANNSAGTLLGFHVSRSRDGDVRSFDFRMPNDIAESIKYRKEREAPIIMSSIPAILLAIPIAVTLWTNDPAIQNWDLLFLLGQMVVAASLAWFAARHRGCSKTKLFAWTFAGALLGVGTWLAILGIYPQFVSVVCSQCKKKRRVEETNCEHCDAEWDAPGLVGIEIRDNAERLQAVPQSASV